MSCCVYVTQFTLGSERTRSLNVVPPGVHCALVGVPIGPWVRPAKKGNRNRTPPRRCRRCLALHLYPSAIPSALGRQQDSGLPKRFSDACSPFGDGFPVAKIADGRTHPANHPTVEPIQLVHVDRPVEDCGVPRLDAVDDG